MSIAQRLCSEIVEPVFNTSQNFSTFNTSKKLNHHHGPTVSAKHRSGCRPVVAQKKKVSKLPPRDTDGSHTLLQKLKSKETLLKSDLIDTAVNTLITGPLKCDIDCVTNVRKRDARCVCKCAHGRVANCKASTKRIQTLSNLGYINSDKACAQIVETVSCGTQFLEKLGHFSNQNNLSTKTMVNKETMALLLKPNSVKNEKPSQDARNTYTNRVSERVSHSHLIAKRWAMSPYPVRGPDF
ncbi:unnamed protein product [Chrysodeixis includens]|uniref:Uncharacterized protein n=1 Tax=Chrysodeixis includens TaxID=689277 RepID=A0A9P0BVK5_CHRIL|nr:unnamed protein product [Chrysodeixis includens]